MQEITRGASIIQEGLLHTTNVTVHVLFGTLALLIGCAQLLGRKGDRPHSSRGRLFVTAMSVVVVTASVGLAIFRFGGFLAVITALAAYWTYSGWRALQISETGPTLGDAAVSIIGLASVATFVLYLPSVRFPWAASVIYSTLTTLVLVCSYDLVRFTFPKHWFASLATYEHAVKMIGAHGALVSAFAGTVLGAWQPYSQILPSIIWTIAMVALPVGHHLGKRRATLATVGKSTIPCA